MYRFHSTVTVSEKCHCFSQLGARPGIKNPSRLIGKFENWESFTYECASMVQAFIRVSPFLLLLGFLVGAWLRCASQEVTVRYSGLGLELAGVFIVAYGLIERQALFGLPSIKERTSRVLRQWFDYLRTLLPGQKGQPLTLKVNTGDSIMVGLTGKLSVWKGVPPDAPIESRIEVLEANLLTLKSEQSDSTQHLQKEVNARRDEIASERKARESAHAALNNQLKELAVGGMHLEWIGVVCLLLGVVLATTSTEIAPRLPDFSMTTCANT
jgi:hypothetical protein